ncbi:hypothetical protein B6N60_02135 [Richelia sinica FACHB-800]|uniref:Uncharacterized protein n=1 Tax=Richelia sinica FACHB-800 TaxID=1357546 RepID=A0A975Y4R2_9NOST|nr:hypothetical protein [Richelia sinica]MBD2666808.1 hypothetical protein [Richelia sinica FACHB-800]QXE23445.1 hypothetical protein B6N60_02135 [Richelia sinica FACHB-800]
MLKRLIQWIKRFFQRFLGGKARPTPESKAVQITSAPPLSDTDLEFLFTELLEGVHQARGQTWAQKWLNNLEHRVNTERWLSWLQGFGERLLATQNPHNELAARLVQLGELNIGPVGDLAYNIGMQLLTRHQGEPIWEYDGPDTVGQTAPEPAIAASTQSEEFPDAEYQTITLEQLLVLLQQDENLRQQIAQQLSLETDDPQLIIQTLVHQAQMEEQSSVTED